MSTLSLNSIPAGVPELTELNIAQAASLLARRHVSSLDLVEATLHRIDATDPLVRAYALVFADEAREAARQADREIARGHLRGPLHGIPIGVKDLLYMKGTPTEAGSRVMANFRPSYDATVVSHLREAGAVIMGKTVTHEFAFGVNTPPTRNAWNLECYPGGSSAGSGAAVAVRSAYGAIGTDTGGSIRVPASMENLVGLKPTFGRVSKYGIFPLSASLDHAGPLTRTVEDCALILNAIAGYDPMDASSIDEPVPDFTRGLENGVAGMVIGIDRDYSFYEGTAPEVRAAVEGVAADLEQAGATIVEVRIPEQNYVTTTLLTILLNDASSYMQQRLRERSADFDPATRLMFELGEITPGVHYVTAQRARSVIIQAVKNTFNAYGLDALLSPTLPITTVPIPDLPLPGPSGEAPMTSLLRLTPVGNLTGLPALSAPCGFASNGLPIGYQVLGRPFAEGTIFRIARAYEKRHNWEEREPNLSMQ